MRAYIGFDDTDFLNSDIGTGKLARRYERLLPAACTVWGVVRQQLLVDPAIPYTSHNSSACVLVEFPDPSMTETLLGLAVHHIEKESLSGSDPGLCFVGENDPALAGLMNFGRLCTREIVAQRDALRAVDSAHLSGHGGTNDGIIGAAAAVGLTAAGWSGRFIEYGNLREFPDPISVVSLEQKGIRVVSLDRDAVCPHPEDEVVTHGWLRPRLWGYEVVLPVVPVRPGVWESMGRKRNGKETKM